MLALEVGKGDEVITTPNTFLASSNCILYSGGTPNFADVESETANISADEIEKKITSRTKELFLFTLPASPAIWKKLKLLLINIIFS